MKFQKQLIAFLFVVCSAQAFSQNSNLSQTNFVRDSIITYKFSISTPWHTFANFGNEKTNTHHYEFHLKYNLTTKHKIGIKVATWKLFAPMGIPLWDSLIMKESEFYPGRLRETGIGVTYQYHITKGLFAAIEILPQLKTYFDPNNIVIAHGFKLYTSYHIGYHFSFFNNRMFLEPQIHCQYWPIDTNIPASFMQEERKWNNYFLFEPNLKFGFNF